MHYTGTYISPLGEILLASDEIGLIGLWFKGSKYYASCLQEKRLNIETPAIRAATTWLDIYFAGSKPDFLPALHLIGSTFQIEVWNLLLQIPYGQTTSYGSIAKIVAQNRGLLRMSAQAVGTAVSRNPVSLIVPCHRVIATDHTLSGYDGGVDKKRALLALESYGKLLI